MKNWTPIEIEPGVLSIPLSRGLSCTIDAEDLPIVREKTWYAHVRHDHLGFYAVHYPGPKMHRVLLGVTDRNIIIDHADGNGLNNRRNNLRIASQAQNAFNRKITVGTGLRGVKPRSSGRWQANICFHRRNIYLGTFETPEEAHAVYLAAAKKLHGEFVPAYLLEESQQ